MRLSLCWKWHSFAGGVLLQSSQHLHPEPWPVPLAAVLSVCVQGRASPFLWECCAGPQCLSPAGPPTLPHTPALCPYRDLAAPALRALRSFAFKLLLMKRGLCALLSQQLASVMFLLGKLRAALYNCQMFSSSKT